MVLRIPLNDGSFALVDDEDVWALDYVWAVRDDESRMVYALKPHPPGGKVLRRIIMGVEKGGYISHINGDFRDCRRSNLTDIHPNANKPKDGANDPVRVTQNDEGMWVASALVGGIRKYVGTFNNSDLAWQEARQALALAAIKESNPA